MIQIAHTGINKTMRWPSRNHGLAIRYLYDHLGNEETKDKAELVYTRSEWMAADIYTKSFNNKNQWHKVCELVNVMDPVNLADVIRRRAQVFKSLRENQLSHQTNRKTRLRKLGNTSEMDRGTKTMAIERKNIASTTVMNFILVILARIENKGVWINKPSYQVVRQKHHVFVLRTATYYNTTQTTQLGRIL